MWVSTALRRHILAAIVNPNLFQSRCGFLPPCDARPEHSGRDEDAVSIPMWVSTALRPNCAWGAATQKRGFNPDVGFYRLATTHVVVYPSNEVQFQSRCGFLPPCDTRTTSTARRTPCFNPDVGFYRLATDGSPSRDASPLKTFQSRCGFLPPCDLRGATRPARSSCFNPDVGFYRLATRHSSSP